MAVITSIGTTSDIVSGKITPKIFSLGGAFSPLSLAPILALQSTRIDGYSASLPIMKVRRVNTGDEVDIYGWNPADPRQYQTSAGGAYETTESLLYPAEQFFVTILYDQSGNGNNAVQTVQASQPELVWEGVTFGSELAVNGDFANWTGDDPDNWTVLNEDANNYITESAGGGEARIVSDNSALINMRQEILTVGKNYKATMDITDVTSGSLYLGTQGAFERIEDYSTVGSKELYFDPLGTFFVVARGGTCDITVDNISVKEVLTWGLPQIEYDGVDDSLDLTLTNPASDYTFISRIQNDNSNIRNTIFDSNNAIIVRYPANVLSNIGYFDGSSHNTPYTGTEAFNATFKLVSTGSSIYADKIELANGLSYSQLPIVSNSAVGGTVNPHKGKINSLYIYNTALSEANVFKISDYLDGAA